MARSFDAFCQRSHEDQNRSAHHARGLTKWQHVRSTSNSDQIDAPQRTLQPSSAANAASMPTGASTISVPMAE
jgi:hypothetical protein